MAETHDFVIIGSGAGGGPLAARLAQRGFDVAVVEAGRQVVALPPDKAVERYYIESGYLAAVGKTVLPVVAGRALGGTTPINSGTCIDPSPELLESWDAECGSMLASELPPHVAIVNDVLGVGPADGSLLGASHHLVARGLRALGRPEPEPLRRNAPACVGSGTCCFGCKDRAKRSADVAWLPMAEAHGATILADTDARSIRTDPHGVEITVVNGTTRTLRCKELVLAGGAIGNPRLIRGNRLGSRWREAGNQLTVHPATKVIAAFPEAIDAHRGIPQGSGFRDPTLPDLLFEGAPNPPEVLLPMLLFTGADLDWWLDRHARLASYGFLCRDHARGSVRWLAGHPILKYDLDPRDAQTMLGGIILLARAFLRAGAERVLLPLTTAAPCNEVTDEQQLDAIDPRDVRAEHIAAMGFHPLGTVGLGRLVDSEHRLAGAPRVRVCDGSVLPGPPGCNPQITIMAMAHRLADRM